MYEERFYRKATFSKFSIEICYKQSDLLIATNRKIDKEQAQKILKKYYTEIENYIEKNPLFLTSLSPLREDVFAPPIVKKMIESSQLTGIGPFSSVAGAIALSVGREILNYADEVIVENGGDIFLKINEDKRVGVYLGKRQKTENLSLIIKQRDYPFGIASSSSCFGPSLNFGRADLVTVVAKNSILADGFATALSNRIKSQTDIKKVSRIAKENSWIKGIVIAFEGKISLWGEIELSN